MIAEEIMPVKPVKKKNKIAVDPKFIVVDLFCGAGGTTTGFAMAGNIAEVIACINHDAKAIQSHWANHPEVVHFNEDITTMYGNVLKPMWQVGAWPRCVPPVTPPTFRGVLLKSPEMVRLKRLLDIYRACYPKAKVILWASLECTNFSKAKGGKERDADSRTLANHLDRYIYTLEPDIIQIENVVEFMAWGPLDENGKPIKRKNGEDWLKWRKHLCGIGYHDEWKELNSANYGAYTSRNRLFGMFAKPGIRIVWPEPTHAKLPEKANLFTSLMKWKAVKEVLDLHDEGKSIFERKKPLVENTLKRIYAGLIKYVAKGDKSFLQKYYSGRPWGKVKDVDSPSGVITTFGGQSLVNCNFIVQRNSGDPFSKIVDTEGPARTVTGTGGNQDLVNCKFILKYNSTSKNGNHNPPDINEPCPVIACQNRLGMISPIFQDQFANCFLAKHYGAGDNVQSSDNHTMWLDKQYSGEANHCSIDQPSGTIMQNDKHTFVKAIYWISRQFTGGGQNQSTEDPAGSVMTVPKLNLMEAKFLMDTNYKNIGKSLDSPCPPILACRKHHYLVNPQYKSAGSDIEKPCFTLIARMDKAPPHIITAECGTVGIQIFDGDSETMVKIKEFMAAYGIMDIRMRMLKILELLKIQGFPADYKLYGNQRGTACCEIMDHSTGGRIV